MREVGITGITRRKKWRTTVRDKNARPAPDLVERRFVAQGADQLWVADITELPMTSSRAYLAIVMDVWRRKVVGWATSTQMPAELVIRALDMALERRGYPQGVIHHSDQGSQYTSKAFKDRCQQVGVRVSMGSVGDCYDNAMAESFFATLKCELLNIVPTFKSFSEADSAVYQFIEGFYNTRRRHSRLGHLSPVQYEAAVAG